MGAVTTETLTRDNLIAGDFDIVTLSAIVASGAGALKRGTLMGKITTGGKLLKSLTAAVDGSQNAYAILAEDVDATSADKVAAVYVAGEFNENAIVLGADWTLALAYPALRDLGIYLHPATK